MKKILLVLIFPLLLSCGNESKMKSELKQYVEKNFNDPESYELVNIKVWDTIYAKELAEKEIKYNYKIYVRR